MQIDPNSPIPVYVQIEQLIEQLIVKKELAPHELVPSVAVLAKQLKVAPLTVHRAYRQLQDRGLIYSAGSKGSFVADSSSQQFVGILVYRQFLLEAGQLPTFSLLIQSICDSLAEKKLPVRILADTLPLHRSPAAVSPDVMSALENGRPMGLILLGHYGAPPLFDLAQNRSLPTVGINIIGPRVDVRLTFDHRDGYRAAFSYLREQGLTETGLFWLDQTNTPAEQLRTLTAIEAEMLQAGLTPNRDWIIGVHEASDWAGYHAFNHFCALPNRPRALVVMDDVIGRGVHMGVLARQMRVPEDLTIIVQCNEDSPIVFPQQWQQCGYRIAQCGQIAVETLRKLLEGGQVPPDIKLPFKWHDAGVASPWDESHVRARAGGLSAPLFRSGRQLLETV